MQKIRYINSIMSYGIMQNKNIIFVIIVAMSSMNDGGGGIGVAAVAAGRRRRRSLYNVRPCGPGQRAIWAPSKKKVTACVSCEEGKYRGDTQHALEECSICKGGRHSSDDLSYCIGDICKVGYFGIKGTAECNICAAGKYSDTDGLFACKECESGRYVAAEGSNTCKGEMCPAGKWGVGGAISPDSVGVCSPCEAGKYSMAGATSCLMCPDGKYSFNEAKVCIDHDKCPGNSYLDIVPRADSSKISCKRCIYSSEYYFAAFVFAIVVIGVNMAFFTYKRTILVGVCLSIIPMCWILFINFCNTKRSDIVWVIISFVINTVSLWPMCSVINNECLEAYKRYRKKQQEKLSLRPQQPAPVKNGVVMVSCAV